MSIVFLDSNALLKLYLSEIGASWLRNFVIGQQITISELALFETANVVRRLYTEGRYTKVEASDLIAQINHDRVSYNLIALGGQAQLSRFINLIINLSTTLRVRSLDAIHLTAAQIVLEDASNLVPPEPLVFVSSDRQLLQVAQALALVTENPEDHP